MKKILIWLLCVAAMTIAMTTRVKAITPLENATLQDSTIDVIAWFCKNDTVTYQVSSTSWAINGTDTTLQGAAAMTMRFNVVDSTPDGYRINCTYLSFPEVDLPDSTSALGKVMSRITARLGEKIVGTTISFETDEYGRITRFDNPDRIKQQAKEFYDESVAEVMKLPEMQEIEKSGKIDLGKLTKDVDADRLVEGYLEEITLLFMNHGNSMRAGEFTQHEDATDAMYDNTTFTSALAEDDGTYRVVIDVVNVMTPDEIKKVVGAIAEAISTDSIPSDFNKELDSRIKIEGYYEDCIATDYLPNGWPYSFVRQQTSSIGDRQKVKQTTINIDDCSFGQ